MKKNAAYELLKNGIIDKGSVEMVRKLHVTLPVRAPLSYTAKIKTKDFSDPLWKTVVPSESELSVQSFELTDPIGDEKWSPVKGIIHRHKDRVLFMPTNICAMYCRFCFRRNVVGKPEFGLNEIELDTALNYIREHTEIWEVIFTGGDPFVLSNAKLKSLLASLEDIQHVRVIRFHTRIIIAKPSRIDSILLRILNNTVKKRKAVYIVSHINHIQEINNDTETACAKLVDRGIPLMNQSVLLKGINDDAGTIEALLRKLVEMRIKRRSKGCWAGRGRRCSG